MTDGARALAVIDASVAVKLVLTEEHTPRANRLYAEYVGPGRGLVAPSLLPNEVTNAVYRRLRRGTIDEPVADAAVNRFATLRFRSVALPELPREAYAFAKRYRLGAIYDSLYVVLARELDIELWTNDERLLNAVRRDAPWVRWIGDYPAPGD